jgi:DNA-binding response OmpR family regulator
MHRGSYPPGFLKRVDTTPIPAVPTTHSTQTRTDVRRHRNSGHRVPTITSQVGDLPHGRVPIVSNNSVCPCCAGTGMLEDKQIDQDGFRYIPNVGVWYNDKRVRLPPAEQRMLGALLANPGRVVTKEGLISYLNTEAETKIIDTWVCKLRGQLKKQLDLEPIVTVWGRGLMWDIRATD